MRRFFALLLIVLPLNAAGQVGVVRPLVFTHLNLIDMTGAAVKADMTVTIVGNRIEAVGKTGEVRVSRDAKVIDAAGKYMIPGLWDMHAHTRTDELTRAIVFPLDVANGVTGIRDMAGDCVGGGDCEGKSTFDVHLAWRRDIEAGTLIGPRMIVGSAFVDGAPPAHPGSMVVTNAEEARRAVRYAKQRGIDFLKVYNKLSRESYFALADEAKKLGVDFAGHVPRLIGAIEASNAGQKSEEHLFGVLTACSGHEADFIAARERVAEASGPSSSAINGVRSEQEDHLSYMGGDCTEFFSALVRNHTWIVPTYNYWRADSEFSFFDLPRMQDDPRLRYIPASIRKQWADLYEPLIKQTKVEVAAKSRRVFQDRLRFVKRLHDAGVQVLAGTDSDMPHTVPGFDLHDELSLLVAGGLTPFEALQTATVNAAKYQNKLDILGTIEKGKLADLVLLDADPLVDISNTKKIAGVIVNGRYLPEKVLSKMLARVEASAEKH